METSSAKQFFQCSDLRRQCITLHGNGYDASEISSKLGCNPIWVKTIIRLYKKGGIQAISNRRPRNNTLRTHQIELLFEFLKKGPQHYGFTNAYWTKIMVKEIVLTLFGREYSMKYISGMLEKNDWFERLYCKEPQVE
jgi:transposase